jgi:hypothetical protein
MAYHSIIVDVVDWRNSLGQAGAGLAADGNNDGVVNGADYDLWRARFGQTAVSSGAHVAESLRDSDRGSETTVSELLPYLDAVPEPSSFTLTATCLIGLIACARRRR